jgi:hypothetical protein
MYGKYGRGKIFYVHKMAASIGVKYSFISLISMVL